MAEVQTIQPVIQLEQRPDNKVDNKTIVLKLQYDVRVVVAIAEEHKTLRDIHNNLRVQQEGCKLIFIANKIILNLGRL